MTTTQRFEVGFLGMLLFIALAFGLTYQARQASGSTVQGNDYMATTTFAASLPVTVNIKPGRGSLNSVNIMGKNTGLMTFYDATTSDVTKRTGQKATSTIQIADFPSNAPEGTYTFDASFGTGLLMVVSGAVPTTTVTWR